MPAKPPPKRSPSVKKRARQNEKKRKYNRAVSSTVKTASKKLVTAVEENKKDELEGALREAVRVISKAASKGVLHKNTASRKISRLSKLLQKTLKPEAA